MTQIKNINAMQELTEVQEDMADTHDKFHNKSLKGKKGYIRELLSSGQNGASCIEF